MQVKERTMRVKAIATGVYAGILRHPEAVFDISAPEFSDRWMIEVDANTPLNAEGDKTLNRLPLAKRAQLKRG